MDGPSWGPRRAVSARWGGASGKRASRVNAATFLTVVTLVLFVRPVDAQAPGAWSFRILERGKAIGMVRVAVARDAEGWTIRSTSEARGSVSESIRQFVAQYDRDWRPRFLTVERAAAGRSTVVHVVIGRSTAHTDIVAANEARWRSHSISPDTIFLPERAYGAYAAVAARLQASGQRAELPLLVAPDGERRAIVNAWERLTLSAPTGAVPVDRHTLALVGSPPRMVHVWEQEGVLLRVDLPAEGITVMRDDLQ